VVLIWYYHGNTRKKKKERRKRSNFVFFSDEKNKIGNLHVTEWFEIISNSNLFPPNFKLGFKTSIFRAIYLNFKKAYQWWGWIWCLIIDG
jgi:hypothetical protein